jgi:internalin A
MKTHIVNNNSDLEEIIERARIERWKSLVINPLGIHYPDEYLTRTDFAFDNVVAIDYLATDKLVLPDSLWSLSNINILTINNCELKSLSSQIESLQNLEYLGMIDNMITELPTEIGKLKKLRGLDLGSNEISIFPPPLAELENLEYLRLSINKLKITSNIKFLTNLRHLRLKACAISSLPPEIGDLTNLRELHLWNNRLENLPNEIRKLKQLELLDIGSNNLNIPPEILENVHKPQFILDYYFDHLAKKPKSINQAKLLILGQGSVGKTSLVQQILHGTFDQNQTKTEEISINQWIVKGQSEIKLNIWDFGGQEIMHATHQFFLSKRSLYLLVLDARLTQEENRVEYWLKIIQSFGGESPVLIVGNKTDQHPLDIDRTGLQKKYPNIVGILETSAATGAGIEALKAEIAKQVDTLPHVRDLLPETWFTVKSKLEELGRSKNFITQDEYLDLCTTNDVSDETKQHTLIGFLHDLGVVLHFQDDPRLEALGILNPQWVTNGVYKILNSHELFQNQGTLTLPLLNKILNLPEYPSNKRLFIVDMMKKFELCYDIEPDKSFLIPDLLPKDEPFTGEWGDALAFQYHYNVLPSSIITRFIVRMNAFVHKTVWRAGVVLKSAGNTALIKADTEDRKIYVWVTGDENTRRDFLSAIRMEFDAIHKTIAKIEATEKVPLPSYPNADPADYLFLLQLERDARESFPVSVEGKIVDINVRELLNGIRPSKNQSTEIFISYGHDDKKFVQRLSSELSKENVESWWDFDTLKGGHDWQREIQQGIKRCDFFIVVLTPQSVESEWVNKEITYANEYKKKVIPIRLKDCERPISIIEKQYIDFEKQTQKAALKQLLVLLKDEK